MIRVEGKVRMGFGRKQRGEREGEVERKGLELEDLELEDLELEDLE